MDDTGLITQKELNTVIPAEKKDKIVEDATFDLNQGASQEEKKTDTATVEETNASVTTASNIVTIPLFPEETTASDSGMQTGGNGAILRYLGYGTTGLGVGVVAAAAVATVIGIAIFIPCFIVTMKVLFWASKQAMRYAARAADMAFDGIGELGSIIGEKIRGNKLTPQAFDALMAIQPKATVSEQPQQLEPAVGGRRRSRRKKKGGSLPIMIMVGSMLLPGLMNAFGGKVELSISGIVAMFLGRLNSFKPTEGDISQQKDALLHHVLMPSPSLQIPLHPFKAFKDNSKADLLKLLSKELVLRAQNARMQMHGGDGENERETTVAEDLGAVGKVLEMVHAGLKQNDPKQRLWNKFKVDRVDVFQNEVLPRCKVLMEYVQLINHHLKDNLDGASYTNPKVGDLLKYTMVGNLIQNELLIKITDSEGKETYTFPTDENQRYGFDCISSSSGRNARTICKMRYFIRQFDKCKNTFEKDFLPPLLEQSDAALKKVTGGKLKTRIQYAKLSLTQLKQLSRERGIKGRSKLSSKDEFVAALRAGAKSRLNGNGKKK